MIQYRKSPGTAGNSDIPERYEDLPSHNIEVFQSENIQNIVDAKLKSKNSVEITYELKKVENSQREKLFELLGNDYLKLLKKSFKESDSQDIADQKARVELALQHPDKWYSLVITEKNTTGLIGDEKGIEKGSKYNALIRYTNKSEKDDVSGGTFGKGSSVYTYSSGLWLWFAYSILSESSNNTNARFVGRGMIAPFVDNQEVTSYLGPIWYARQEQGSKIHQALPFRNDKAHSVAKEFGLKVRDDDDYGTTYLIPVFWPDNIKLENINEDFLARKLKDEIIKRWFISIYNKDLKCYIKAKNVNLELDDKYLYEISELSYKLEILDFYNGKEVSNRNLFKRVKIPIELPKLKTDQQQHIVRKLGKKIATEKNEGTVELVVRILSQDEEKSFKGFKDYEDIDTSNRVALTRNKGMLINYYPYASKNKGDLKKISDDKSFEAILFCGRQCNIDQDESIVDHIELFLGYSENPAHNEWIHDQQDIGRCKLKRFEGKSPYPSTLIYRLFRNLESAIQEIFPKDAEPPYKEDICKFWKSLADMPHAGDTKPGLANINYKTLSSGFDDKGRYYWNLELKVNEEKDEDMYLIKFQPYLKSHEKDIKNPSDFVMLGIKEFYDDFEVTFGNDIIEELTIKKGQTLKVRIGTCSLNNRSIYKNMKPALEIRDKIL